MRSEILCASNVRRIGCLLTLLLFSSVAFAQTTKGLITGSVSDDSGAALKGASVHVLPLTVSGVTDSDGQFMLPEIAGGHYTLTVSFVGFETYRQEIDVAAGQTLNLSITLKVAYGEPGNPGVRRARARRSRRNQSDADRGQHCPDASCRSHHELAECQCRRCARPPAFGYALSH